MFIFREGRSSKRLHRIPDLSSLQSAKERKGIPIPGLRHYSRELCPWLLNQSKVYGCTHEAFSTLCQIINDFDSHLRDGWLPARLRSMWLNVCPLAWTWSHFIQAY